MDIPHGTQTVSNKQRSMALRENVNLSKVLFVPNLSCNLVFVERITKELNCSVPLFDKSCVLRDYTSSMLFGTCNQMDGVYYYGKAPLKNQSKAIRTSEV